MGEGSELRMKNEIKHTLQLPLAVASRSLFLVVRAVTDFANILEQGDRP